MADYQQNTGIKPLGNFVVPSFNSSVFPQYVDQFVIRAKEKSPTLASFYAEVMAADENVQAATGDYFPRVDLELTGSKGDNLGGVVGSEDLVSALLVMRWNIFSGGLDKAEVKENQYLKASARDDFLAAKRLLERDIRSIWASRKANLQRITDFQKQTQTNAELVRIYDEQFGIGRRTLLDLLDTQNSLFSARTNYINAIFNALFSSYQLLALEGSLVDYFSIKEPTDYIVPPQPVHDTAVETKSDLPIKSSGPNITPAGLNLKPLREDRRLVLVGFDSEEAAKVFISGVYGSENPELKDLSFTILENNQGDVNVETDTLTLENMKSICKALSEDAFIKQEDCLIDQK